jgi:hypothetical protein
MTQTFGYPITNVRQYIILIFLMYLYLKTKDKFLRICFLIIISIHLYKLYKNHSFNKKYYDNYKGYILFYNTLLVISLLLFLIKGTYLPFLILFIVTRYLITNLNKEEITYIKIIPHSDIFIIIMSSILFILYPDYKYKFIFIMEILNHVINMIYISKKII